MGDDEFFSENNISNINFTNLNMNNLNMNNEFDVFNNE